MFLRRFLKPKKRTKLWIAIILISTAAFFAVHLDYPRYWNATADWVNPKIESVNAPHFLLSADKWGILRAIDGFFRLPHFWEKPYVLGLDLKGGVQLLYKASLSNVPKEDESEALAALRDALERRVNFLGVSEPIVQLQQGADGPRILVELAGIADPNAAIKAIGTTPFLEFKEPRSEAERFQLLSQLFTKAQAGALTQEQASRICSAPDPQTIAAFTQLLRDDPCFRTTGLTGQYLKRATPTTHPQTGAIEIALQFNEEGAKLFEEITGRNVGSQIAIYLDGAPLSAPRVENKISGGNAVITGRFSAEEARNLARNLNAGALPVPIELVGQQRIGASLGEESIQASLKTGIFTLIAILIFMVVVYRLSGVFAVFALAFYLIMFMAIVKLVPITLTLAGIAGIILSLGMAVDANVLVAERLREEFREGKENAVLAIDRAFQRAWPSIRDGNMSNVITAAILFWFSTSFVKGFALTLGIGILLSMFSSMIMARILAKLLVTTRLGRWKIIWTR